MLSHLSVKHSLRTRAFVAYLCAAKDSERTSGTAQSAANTPRYQALDVQRAVLPRITETKATGVYHMGWQPIPLQMGLL